MRRLVMWLGAAMLLAGRSAPAGPVEILNNGSVWRVLHSWNAPGAKAKDAVVEIVSRYKKHYKFRFMTLYPSEDWAGPDFDDSSWCRMRFYSRYFPYPDSPCVSRVSIRGRFTVTDPSRVRSLSLTLGYKGGVLVRLNGREVAREHLPAGKIAPGALAEGPPGSARRMDRHPLPTGLLRRGTNVLAVEIHAAAPPEGLMKTYARGRRSKKLPPACGLEEIRLETNAASGITPNVERPKGILVWNGNIAAPLYDTDWGDPHEKLRPVELAGARNGCCSGRVVVGSGGPIENIRAEMGDLLGAGGRKIPASAVRVAYGGFNWQFPDGRPIVRGCYPAVALNRSPKLTAQAEKALSAAPHRARRLPIRRDQPWGLQSVWVTVRIPEDAAAGDYRGTLSLRCEGGRPVRVPVELKVAAWTLPDPADRDFLLGAIQSPESAARVYRVEPWSARHWELIGRSLDLLSRLGNKVLYLPLIAEGQFNSQSMVLWVKGRDGSYTHDFSRLERYLDLARRSGLKPKYVVVGVWDFEGEKVFKKTISRVSVLDPKTGKIEQVRAPEHGTPEALEFWRPVLTGTRKILAGRGLEKAMVLGFGSDYIPKVAAVRVFHSILPGVGWQMTRHLRTEFMRYEGDGENYTFKHRIDNVGAVPEGAVPVVYQSNVYDSHSYDPDDRRVCGWSSPKDFTYLMRGRLGSNARYRAVCEECILANRRGMGHLGADFWPYWNESIGRLRGLWHGGSKLRLQPLHILAPGPEGAVRSVRYELLRENLQECEARVFLEKLLTAKRLKGDLARRCQAVLDERTRWHRMLLGTHADAVQIGGKTIQLSWPYSGIDERARRLYEACAEAARAVRR